MAEAVTGNTRAPTGLLIVAHGERGGSTENRLAHAIARRMRAAGRYAEVEVGFLRARPRVETSAARIAADRLAVYPLFMSDSYYVRTAIPERLGLSPKGRDAKGRPVRVLPPLGIDPALPPLIASLARLAAEQAGVASAAAHLLLVAHGSSKSGESALAARAVAEKVASIADFISVDVAFLEEEPFLDEVLSRLPGPAVLLGLFAGDGLHAGEDLPASVAKSGRRDIALSGPIAAEPALLDLIEAALARAG
jgi:sirohydrochlorin ferrochelatase